MCADLLSQKGFAAISTLLTTTFQITMRLIMILSLVGVQATIALAQFHIITSQVAVTTACNIFGWGDASVMPNYDCFVAAAAIGACEDMYNSMQSTTQFPDLPCSCVEFLAASNYLLATCSDVVGVKRGMPTELPAPRQSMNSLDDLAASKTTSVSTTKPHSSCEMDKDGHKAACTSDISRNTPSPGSHTAHPHATSTKSHAHSSTKHSKSHHASSDKHHGSGLTTITRTKSDKSGHSHPGSTKVDSTLRSVSSNHHSSVSTSGNSEDTRHHTSSVTTILPSSSVIRLDTRDNDITEFEVDADKSNPCIGQPCSFDGPNSGCPKACIAFENWMHGLDPFCQCIAPLGEPGCPTMPNAPTIPGCTKIADLIARDDGIVYTESGLQIQHSVPCYGQACTGGCPDGCTAWVDGLAPRKPCECVVLVEPLPASTTTPPPSPSTPKTTTYSKITFAIGEGGH